MSHILTQVVLRTGSTAYCQEGTKSNIFDSGNQMNTRVHNVDDFNTLYSANEPIAVAMNML